MRFITLAAVLLLTLTPVSARKTLDLDSATIADLNAAFSAGTLTSERLVQLSLARIQAYDRQGPTLRAVITVNPKALETARSLDAERKAKGPRSPLHGIPVALKDNYDTADLPTTGGSLLLEGSVPPDDAFLVKKLRAAGAVIIAKLNMSEFASGAAHSSLGGMLRNPHDLLRSPSGSSGGTGAAIASAFATVGMGTDTGGSIRGPSTANGIVGLKPTHGLLSRDGIIPLALSFDTGGPMARSVADVATVLGLMTGVDSADAATKKSEGRFETDYTKYLKADALKGARLGIARDFMGADADVDWVINSSIAAMKRAGATFVDVRVPKWLIDSKGEFYNAVRYPEFPVQIAAYLATLGPKYPKNIDQMIERAMDMNALAAGRRRSESEPLGIDAARSRQRHARGLSLYVGARSRAARSARRARRHPRREQARRHRLSHVAAPAAAHRRAARRAGRPRGIRDKPREPVGLPRSDRAGRLHRRRSAGRHIVHGHRVQRRQVDFARLRLRTDHPRAPPARAHAEAGGRGDYRSVGNDNRRATRQPPLAADAGRRITDRF